MNELNLVKLASILLLAMLLGGCNHRAAASVATPTPLPASSTAADVFARVSPAVAFIETPTNSGSGVLIEDGYIVTNAHVVWPFQTVRVVFPDGSEVLDAPVLNWDLMADLALIGPLQTTINPARLVDGENLPVGSEVFLVGYPGEAESFPQPTLTRGLIARLREWEATQITYFQTDVPIARGQSGGVLVSEKGEVIGISGFFFTEVRYGLVASAADILPRIRGLMAGEDVAGLGRRAIPVSGGKFGHEFRLQNEWDSKLYIVDEPSKTSLDIILESKNDAAFALLDVFGQVLVSANKGGSGIEAGSTTTHLAAPHCLVLGQFSEQPGDFRVNSNRRLIPYEDKDDGSLITVGQTVVANMDCPGDTDYFVLDLAAGETINILVDSVTIDPFLMVDYPGATAEEIVSDKDSGGGLFGQNAALTYTAPNNGSYFIVTGDTNSKRIGGYFLTVTSAPSGTMTVAP
jgi:hypothetical protein